jgi:hypothetical protein
VSVLSPSNSLMQTVPEDGPVVKYCISCLLLDGTMEDFAHFTFRM